MEVMAKRDNKVIMEVRASRATMEDKAIKANKDNKVIMEVLAKVDNRVIMEVMAKVDNRVIMEVMAKRVTMVKAQMLDTIVRVKGLMATNKGTTTLLLPRPVLGSLWMLFTFKDFWTIYIRTCN
ncbi:Hypothetical predicted protein [Pelobates cultripes]|uniref:Uncharacterized protein n=1 Tax=Pelobates cultripes TaxID=61616 RepID=A0AAD1WT41_PELCU|nr:Hypothetical predicted protein [Pelobates cultripes]